MNTAVDYSTFVFASNDDIKTTSLLVAEKFGKLHKDVLKKIESLECSAEFIERNFAPIEIDVKVGFGIKKSPAFEMTKDGFMFLVMGFTGKAAAKVKESYINAFNFMRDKLFSSTAYDPAILDRLIRNSSFPYDAPDAAIVSGAVNEWAMDYAFASVTGKTANQIHADVKKRMDYYTVIETDVLSDLRWKAAHYLDNQKKQRKDLQKAVLQMSYALDALALEI